MATRTPKEIDHLHDDPQMMHVAWDSGIETIDLRDCEHGRAAGRSSTIETFEIRADGAIVRYQPRLTILDGRDAGFVLTYRHPGTWLSGAHSGKDADGDRGIATYTSSKVGKDKVVTWQCAWQGTDGKTAEPQCTISPPDASRVYAVHTRALRDRAFRASILKDAPCCAISGEDLTCVLDAAHILPVAWNGRDEVSNALVLRKDLHALFDAGFIGIDEQGKFMPLRNLSDEYMKLLKAAPVLEAAKIPAVARIRAEKNNGTR